MHVAIGRDQVLGVAAVEIPAGVDRCRAEVLPSGAAEPARAVGAGQPGHADPVADREPGGTRPDRLDLADHLVAGGDVRPLRLEVAFGQVQVRAADAAAEHPDQQLPSSRLRYRPVDQLKRPSADRRWADRPSTDWPSTDWPSTDWPSTDWHCAAWRWADGPSADWSSADRPSADWSSADRSWFVYDPRPHDRRAYGRSDAGPDSDTEAARFCLATFI